MLKRLSVILQEWKDKHSPKNISVHPKNGKGIEYAFSVGGKHYYKFKSELEIPKKRFAYAQQFHKEMENKCTKEFIKDWCKMMLEHLNKGELIKCAEIVREMDYRTDWAFEPDSLLRFASVIYFDLKENVDDYDFSYNQSKVELFKKKELLPLFLKKLMDASHPLLELSTQDLAIYLREFNDILKKQNSLIRDGKDKKQLTETDTSHSWMLAETKDSNAK